MIEWILSKLVKLITYILLIIILLVGCLILPPTFNLLTDYIKSALNARGLKWIYDLMMLSLFTYLFPYKICRWYKDKKNN